MKEKIHHLLPSRAARRRDFRIRQVVTPDFVIEISQRAIETVLLLAAPTLILSLLTGLVVSLFQAVTQINEATLTFLPKILAVALALFLFGPWMLTIIVEFTSSLLMKIPLYVH